MILKNPKDSSFVSGNITSEDGRYKLAGIKPGEYYLETSNIGYVRKDASLLVGKLSEFLDLGVIER